MARREPQELRGGEVPPGREFTEVARSLEDVAHLRRIGVDLHRWMHEERPGEDAFRVEGEAEGRPWQHVVVRGAPLRTEEPFVAVGFCGVQREDAPREDLVRADEELIEQFPGQPHILAYSTFAREEGRFDNLVCFRGPGGIDDWRENEVHAGWVARLAHLSYVHVRLHRGEVPGGLAGIEGLRLLRTGYYHYGEDPPWVGVREYPAGLPGEDAGE